MKKNFFVALMAVLASFALISPAGAEFSCYDLAASGVSKAISSFERKNIVGDIYEYSFNLKVGSGVNDIIGIHRVVKELAPFRAQKTSSAVMMVHGDAADFNSAFLMSSLSDKVAKDQSMAVYLAGQNIDVWGIDFRWTKVSDCSSGCSFMNGWNTATNLGDVKTAVKIARAVRLLDGSGAGKMFLAGHSSGAFYAYAYANEETKISAVKRTVKGIIPMDMVYKFDPANIDQINAAAGRLQALQSAGVAYTDEAMNLKAVAYYAAIAPDGHDLDADLTNKQVALGALAATWASYAPLSAPTPQYHYCAGEFDENQIPAGLVYTDFGYMIDFANAVPGYQSINDQIDIEELWSNESNQFADRLQDITVPVLYVGSAGGIGQYGTYTQSLMGSTDITNMVVSLLPQGYEVADYGHIDMLYGQNAKDLVWLPVSEWIKAR